MRVVLDEGVPRQLVDALRPAADAIRRAKPGQHLSIGIDGTYLAKSVVGGRTIVEELPRVAPFDG